MKADRIYNASAEPISLAEAKMHSRVDSTDDDEIIRLYIAAAREYVENWSGTAIVESTYAFYFDIWQSEYNIYKPINSITTFEYKNADNVGVYGGSLTGSDYHYNSSQGLITLGNSVMTDIYNQSNAVKITAVVGQENIGEIRSDVKQAMLLMIGHWYENREEVSVVQLHQIPMGAKDLLASVRDHRI
ncbi:MAG: phage gp6-like head-tail connector protein [Ketobacter sp.]|nr:phage gp6-like head-tail connector protein [Ketobacter sp.]